MSTNVNVGDQYYLTRAQYNARKNAGTLEVGAEYYITDEEFLAVNTTTSEASRKVKANATSVATLGDAQVRNITISTTDLEHGVSALATGDIYLVYEV